MAADNGRLREAVLPSAREEGACDAVVRGMKSELVPTVPSQTYPAATVVISGYTRKELTGSLISPHCLSEKSAFQSIIGLLQCAGRGGMADDVLFGQTPPFLCCIELRGGKHCFRLEFRGDKWLQRGLRSVSLQSGFIVCPEHRQEVRGSHLSRLPGPAI